MKRNSRTSKATPRTVATLAEYARQEGISKATATRRNRTGAIAWTEDVPPRIDLAATKELVREMSTATTDPELRAARLEILKTEAKLRTLRLKQREHSLVEAQEVEAIMLEAFGGIRGGFLGLVPWLHGEIIAQGKKDHRAACFAIGERVEEVVFSVYVHLSRALGTLAGESDRKTLRMANEAWRSAFGSRWEDEMERILNEQKGGSTK